MRSHFCNHNMRSNWIERWPSLVIQALIASQAMVGFHGIVWQKDRKQDNPTARYRDVSQKGGDAKNRWF